MEVDQEHETRDPSTVNTSSLSDFADSLNQDPSTSQLHIDSQYYREDSNEMCSAGGENASCLPPPRLKPNSILPDIPAELLETSALPDEHDTDFMTAELRDEQEVEDELIDESVRDQDNEIIQKIDIIGSGEFDELPEYTGVTLGLQETLSVPEVPATQMPFEQLLSREENELSLEERPVTPLLATGNPAFDEMKETGRDEELNDSSSGSVEDFPPPPEFLNSEPVELDLASVEAECGEMGELSVSGASVSEKIPVEFNQEKVETQATLLEAGVNESYLEFEDERPIKVVETLHANSMSIASTSHANGMNVTLQTVDDCLSAVEECFTAECSLATDEYHTSELAGTETAKAEESKTERGAKPEASEEQTDSSDTVYEYNKHVYLPEPYEEVTQAYIPESSDLNDAPKSLSEEIAEVTTIQQSESVSCKNVDAVESCDTVESLNPGTKESEGTAPNINETTPNINETTSNTDDTTHICPSESEGFIAGGNVQTADECEDVKVSTKDSGETKLATVASSSISGSGSQSDAWDAIDSDMDEVTKRFTEGLINASQLTQLMNRIIAKKTRSGRVVEKWQRQMSAMIDSDSTKSDKSRFEEKHNLMKSMPDLLSNGKARGNPFKSQLQVPINIDKPKPWVGVTAENTDGEVGDESKKITENADGEISFIVKGKVNAMRSIFERTDSK